MGLRLHLTCVKGNSTCPSETVVAGTSIRSIGQLRVMISRGLTACVFSQNCLSFRVFSGFSRSRFFFMSHVEGGALIGMVRRCRIPSKNSVLRSRVIILNNGGKCLASPCHLIRMASARRGELHVVAGQFSLSTRTVDRVCHSH